MIYCTFNAYLNGNIDNVYRAIDGTNICGEPGGTAQDFPYMYFVNILDLNNRRCVKTCPSMTDGTLSNLECFSGSCTYTVTFNDNGMPSGAVTSADFLGY